MTPADAIAALDRQLAAHGQSVVVRRAANPNPIDSAIVKAFVRPAGAADVIDGIAEAGDQTVVVSPASLGDWPAAAAELPRRGDFVVIAGYEAAVKEARPVRIGNVVVRIDLIVRGRVG